MKPVTTQFETPGCPTPFSSRPYPTGVTRFYSFLDTLPAYGFGTYFGIDGVGTSFATPMVTGSVAVLMAATPGLTGAQYRSLVVNSGRELDQYPNTVMAPPQTAGNGQLDLLGGASGWAGSVDDVSSICVSTSGDPCGRWFELVDRFPPRGLVRWH